MSFVSGAVHKCLFSRQLNTTFNLEYGKLIRRFSNSIHRSERTWSQRFPKTFHCDILIFLSIPPSYKLRHLLLKQENLEPGQTISTFFKIDSYAQYVLWALWAVFVYYQSIRGIPLLGGKQCNNVRLDDCETVSTYVASN